MKRATKSIVTAQDVYDCFMELRPGESDEMLFRQADKIFGFGTTPTRNELKRLLVEALNQSKVIGSVEALMATDSPAPVMGPETPRSDPT